MFGIYTFADAIRVIIGIVFGTGFYAVVLRPMRIYAKDCENFRKFVEAQD